MGFSYVHSAVHHVYRAIDGLPTGKRTMVYCSFLEIYKEELKDLLSARQSSPALQQREDKEGRVFVEGKV